MRQLLWNRPFQCRITLIMWYTKVRLWEVISLNRLKLHMFHFPTDGIIDQAHWKTPEWKWNSLLARILFELCSIDITIWKRRGFKNVHHKCINGLCKKNGPVAWKRRNRVFSQACENGPNGETPRRAWWVAFSDEDVSDGEFVIRSLPSGIGLSVQPWQNQPLDQRFWQDKL